MTEKLHIVGYWDEERCHNCFGIRGKGVVSEKERVEGQSYLENCGHYHVWKKPSGRDFMDEIADVITQAIADKIDAEILSELLKEAK